MAFESVARALHLSQYYAIDDKTVAIRLLPGIAAVGGLFLYANSGAFRKSLRDFKRSVIPSTPGRDLEPFWWKNLTTSEKAITGILATRAAVTLAFNNFPGLERHLIFTLDDHTSLASVVLSGLNLVDMGGFLKDMAMMLFQGRNVCDEIGPAHLSTLVFGSGIFSNIVTVLWARFNHENLRSLVMVGGSASNIALAVASLIINIQSSDFQKKAFAVANGIFLLGQLSTPGGVGALGFGAFYMAYLYLLKRSTSGVGRRLGGR